MFDMFLSGRKNMAMELLHSHKWYFTKEELENHSPSRKDGVSLESESHFRKLYCSFIQELGIELKVPQVTIATAMILCHRFYTRQSLAKNDWQIMAAVSMFLACKAEDTPRCTNDFVIVAYKLMYKWDPSAPQRIRQREIFVQQKDLLLVGERLLLAAVAFDLNVEQPYKSLVVALKKLDIPHKEIVKVAWNFVNDWLQTSLCLQFRPSYIAAGSVYLAAKLLKVKLPKLNGVPWWMQFDVSPKRMQDVLQQMNEILRLSQKQTPPPRVCGMKTGREIRSRQTMVNSSESCISSVKISNIGSHNAKSSCVQKLPSADINATKETEWSSSSISNQGSAISTVDDGVARPTAGECNRQPSCEIVRSDSKCNTIDVNHIKELMRKRKIDRRKESTKDMEDEINSESWIERELENGIEPSSSPSKKRKIL
ncbi:kinase activator [Lithospermum erythrorhizon]|uniref:Kinase activator n=1 Tax=Lithospermum erythrorhizon TaxID=34254 RepID=A0AAV3RJI7_LITER